ncbi:MAG: sugar phosphate isomerase/epimerase [Lachnospiraceae bacterium]|nr:sugar phosphate isomerase/epimerase [Candidatus Minthocola equi]
MSPRYSLVYLTTGSTSPAEMIDIAAAAGYDCIDARTIPMGLPGEKTFDISTDRRLFLDTKHAIERSGIAFESIENATVNDGKDVSRYAPFLEAAAELGVKHVLSNIWSKDKAFACDQFAKLCEMAAGFGQNIDLEFVTWAQVTDIKEAQELLQNAGCKNASIIVDTLHFHRSRIPWEDLANMPDELAYCLHICDAPEGYPEDPEALAHTAREGRLYPGEGVVDIARMAAMKNWSVYGIEIPNTGYWDQKGYRKHAEDALRKTKAYLEQKEKETKR